MVAEAFIGSFGIIGFGGIVAFALGSIMMFHTSLPSFGLPLSVVAAATAVTGGFFLLVLAIHVAPLAAAILAPVPQAMQRCYLATLFDIAGERSSTIVFPFPIDLMQAWAVRTPARSGSG